MEVKSKTKKSKIITKTKTSKVSSKVSTKVAKKVKVSKVISKVSGKAKIPNTTIPSSLGKVKYDVKDVTTIYLPSDRSVSFINGEVIIKESENENKYKLEGKKLLKLVKDKWIEQKIELDTAVDELSVLIEPDGGMSSELLFDNILKDLLKNKKLDWIPQNGFVFYEPNKTFLFFATEKSFQVYKKTHNVDEAWKQYKFPSSSSGYEDIHDLREEFRTAFL